ncbi:MAG: succinylglutamate desuccinylase/aspartoacylase family protein [Armatimonadota bacterium]|nr:succinylglutamate desuccinylase/aspartoacylase family protein [Armatimonadota bacterium]MDR7451844.1 succinylglutamate desuccinylase/aspartoacylase family protein [Armatimonadota bacterium]MDR7467569.1 succinylglutamate desuccinylase/aspartoacylase family protein [Armatimonadota bacterium]MDR7494470.1 succinylglutamate desuccinylase/aspartoacylase family protein [Armatimonadota bacterium]MDR7499731.1 succinylglutamate desuccinylase/aspartoacylase family protein [Armatimonadota bacterium]
MFQFGETTVAPGQVARTSFRLLTCPDGDAVDAPVVIMHGARPGPVLWIQACIHGNEVGGTLALHRLLALLPPSRLRGTIVAVPILNVPAFRARSRESPVDHANLNRVFPGSAAGRFSDQMAHRIWGLVRETATAALDLHSAGDLGRVPFYAIYHADGSAASRTARRMAEAVGTPYLWASRADWLAGAMFTRLTQEGIPAVIVEVGGGDVTDDDLRHFEQALRGVLAALEMVDEPVLRQQRYTILGASQMMQVRRGGILIPGARPGEIVPRDAVVAELVDAYGDVVETVRAPFDRGFVASMRRRGLAVHPGERVSIMLEVAGEETGGGA